MFANVSYCTSTVYDLIATISCAGCQLVMSWRKKQLRSLGPHYNAVISIKNDSLKCRQAAEMHNVNP